MPWGDSDLEKIKGNDNCWPDLMKRTGYLTNNNLSITGGSKNSNYFVSLNYLYNEGIIKEQSYNRLNLRLNSDHKIGDRIKFGHSVNLYASEQTSQRDFDWRDTYAASFRYSPLNAMYDKDGDLLQYPILIYKVKLLAHCGCLKIQIELYAIKELMVIFI